MAGVKGFSIDGKWILACLVILLIATNGYWILKQREQMRVVRVIDGDTLVIKTGERVRLVGLDAPEIGQCGSKEATTVLDGLTLNKIIYIEGSGRDSWGRKLGVVWSGKVNVNLKMIESGWAKYDSFSDEKIPVMKEAGEKAEMDKRGIFGQICDKKEICGILGNIDESTGRKYYHVPGCPTYARVKIDEKRGEKIFCTENEASAAGFYPAPDCLR